MPNFESGITSYVHATATVDVFFPVDKRGSADISCHQCPYLSSNERMCQLNKEPTAYPNKYVGGKCPLKIINNMEANENESI